MASLKCKLTVLAGEHDRAYSPVNVELPWSYEQCASVKLVDAKTKEPLPAQVAKSANGIALAFLIKNLKAGEKQVLTATASAAAPASPAVEVSDRAQDGRVDVKVGGKIFTSYHYASKWVRPFLYPMIGPFGAQVTRNWPIVGSVKGEHKDHHHHKSIWVAYGECDEVDNWSEEKGHGWQRHRDFLTLASGHVFGQIVAKNDWCADSGKKQFEEVRDMRFYALPGGQRLFEIGVTFTMTEKQVTFRDTKEGGLVSVRVASSMDVRNGGRIENGYGGTNEAETWGKKAPWCDYSGTVGGKHVGIAILDHDKNPRYPTEWHVRDYGLMTANCFAWNHYRPEDGVKGDMTFKKGSVTHWKYRVYVHKGDARAGNVKGRFMEFVAPPKVSVG